jgi:hypothetical protein
MRRAVALRVGAAGHGSSFTLATCLTRMPARHQTMALSPSLHREGARQPEPLHAGAALVTEQVPLISAGIAGVPKISGSCH